jgi:hypothetical protein
MITVEQCKPGTVVWYAPDMTGSVRFRGVIGQAQPTQVGGTWVVTLVEMVLAYGIWRGTPGRSRVNAAALDSLFIDAQPSGNPGQFAGEPQRHPYKPVTRNGRSYGLCGEPGCDREQRAAIHDVEPQRHALEIGSDANGNLIIERHAFDPYPLPVEPHCRDCMNPADHPIHTHAFVPGHFNPDDCIAGADNNSRACGQPRDASIHTKGTTDESNGSKTPPTGTPTQGPDRHASIPQITEADRAAAHALPENLGCNRNGWGDLDVHSRHCDIAAQLFANHLANHAASARAEEREACAAVATKLGAAYADDADNFTMAGAAIAAKRIADAISRRSP